ncbi:MAG TPA: SDR family oxidoreductase [Geminicoccaceae bacterium]|nr:SDR family oxidoreductase [Geminicoccus sp.]HMU53220.1 SDR family oxidoreductase [Geminicoccaceae bacterium]
MSGVAGKVVVVAGASSGMGRATALAAAREGADVVLAGRNAAALDEVAASSGGLAVPTDATDPEAVGRLVARALDRFGRIDALVNAVGTNLRQRSLGQLTAQSWAMMIEANLTAAFNLTRAVVPPMREHGDGLIVHIASVAARRPDMSGVSYQASKAGVAALAHATMEEERQNGIRVTALLPGFTDTPLVLQRPTPPDPAMLARALKPEDIAETCLFLLRLPARAHVAELVLVPSR